MNNEQSYDKMSKEDLIVICNEKDKKIKKYLNVIHDMEIRILDKKNVMEMYGCESDKALRILKLMFQMGYGTKIGKEYYTTQKSQIEFVDCVMGKEVYI